MADFSNADEKEFEKNALGIMRDRINLGAMSHDWKADRESLELLREMLDGANLEEAGRVAGLNGPTFAEIIESDDASDDFIAENAEYIVKAGRALAFDPLMGQDPDEMDVSFSVSVSFSEGGPTQRLVFSFDSACNPLGADVVYLEGGKKAVLELNGDETDVYAEHYGLDRENVAAMLMKKLEKVIAKDERRPNFGLRR